MWHFMAADCQAVSRRLRTPWGVEYAAPSLWADQYCYCFFHLPVGWESDNSDAVREANTAEVKKVACVNDCVRFRQTSPLAGEQNIQFDMESFFFPS